MSASPNSLPAKRIWHCTFYKCGSQWIRDLLTDPLIAEYSKCKLTVSGTDFASGGWPSLPDGGIASPVYTVGDAGWTSRKDPSPSDRCLVVIRDPRDMVVSLVFSMNFSHTPDGVNRLLRRPIRNASRVDRLQLGMHLISHWSEYIKSWFFDKAEGAYITKYETLLADEAAEFGRIISYLGWPVPSQVVAEVAAMHSFQARTGRKRGEENEFSHRRKGIAGDWRNHFDRELGRLFEESFPDLLRITGYEPNSDWWRELPETIAESVQDITDERARLLKVLEQHEKELAVVREAAEQRLEKLQILTKSYEELEKQKAMFEDAARDRLKVISELEAQLGLLRVEMEALRTQPAPKPEVHSHAKARTGAARSR